MLIVSMPSYHRLFEFLCSNFIGIGFVSADSRALAFSAGGDGGSVFEHGERGQVAAVIWSVRGSLQDVPSQKLLKIGAIVVLRVGGVDRK
jgi:hypothetical protein